MKHVLLSALIGLLSLGFVAEGVEAKRLGGGANSGLKRQTPPPQPAQPVPASPAPTPGATTPGAAAATPGAAAAAATPKRSWMGPVAGLAAGLGIAALLSHFGLGAGLANFVTILLMLVAAFFVIRFLMRRFGPARSPSLATPQGMQFAGHGAPSGAATGAPAFGAASAAAGGTALQPPRSANPLPAGFDTEAFVRVAKLIFIRMQAANDANNLDDLRQFSTPEMFAVFRLELQDRKGATQRTDVVQLDAEVLDYAEDSGQYIVSVRFHGLIREDEQSPAALFDEVWHLVKPTDGSREWAIAGIAQRDVV
ncbi:Tim44 domain-containing protein [Piscinibacter sp. HJYY11]|uniref:Tim44 domain-containing protein n=1 Tax=Piscinibacter sp. HJYY11 TaxID=2801333 RepID=UPI00191FA73B|nr:Tim44-like domain-containing protein [Piscinibacter sp. HJYY11]MBL0728858.1 Tim44 domain-containing protein [Piscinibacter sp. HJYY11]